jgi:hypothetical protein
MDISKRLPTIKDFRTYGKFGHLQDLDKYKELPLAILYHIYPDYLFLSGEIPAETLNLIKSHCIVMKEFAKYEDEFEKLKDQKELQIRRLEDKIHNYYLSRENDCKCSMKSNK